MSLCLTMAGKAAMLGASAFTLTWTHSIEKTRWEEDWMLTPSGLVISEARVQGSGAGMEPPEGAHFDGEWWRYRPSLPPLPKLVLGASGKAGAWTIRLPGRTLRLDGVDTAIIAACPPAEPSSLPDRGPSPSHGRADPSAGSAPGEA